MSRSTTQRIEWLCREKRGPFIRRPTINHRVVMWFMPLSDRRFNLNLNNYCRIKYLSLKHEQCQYWILVERQLVGISRVYDGISDAHVSTAKTMSQQRMK